jgi:hypothetical protein
LGSALNGESLSTSVWFGVAVMMVGLTLFSVPLPSWTSVVAEEPAPDQDHDQAEQRSQ